MTNVKVSELINTVGRNIALKSAFYTSIFIIISMVFILMRFNSLNRKIEYLQDSITWEISLNRIEMKKAKVITEQRCVPQIRYVDSNTGEWQALIFDELEEK